MRLLYEDNIPYSPPDSIAITSYGVTTNPVQIMPSDSSTMLADSDIQQELQHQIQDIGSLPYSAGFVYMIHFPPGITITESNPDGSLQRLASISVVITLR